MKDNIEDVEDAQETERHRETKYDTPLKGALVLLCEVGVLVVRACNAMRAAIGRERGAIQAVARLDELPECEDEEDATGCGAYDNCLLVSS